MGVVEGVEGCVMGRGEVEFSGGMRKEREEGEVKVKRRNVRIKGNGG